MRVNVSRACSGVFLRQSGLSRSEYHSFARSQPC